MHALLALAIGSAMLGTDVGWQPAEDGGLEYIIQIEPETLARLKTGDQLSAAIRPVLQDVRRYRVVIGTGPLPHIALPDNSATQPAQPVVPALPGRAPSTLLPVPGFAPQASNEKLPEYSVLLPRRDIGGLAEAAPENPRPAIAPFTTPLETLSKIDGIKTRDRFTEAPLIGRGWSEPASKESKISNPLVPSTAPTASALRDELAGDRYKTGPPRFDAPAKAATTPPIFANLLPGRGLPAPSVTLTQPWHGEGKRIMERPASLPVDRTALAANTDRYGMPLDRYGSAIPAPETKRPAITPASPVAPPSTPPSKSDLFDRDLLNREFSTTRPAQPSVKQVADRPVLKPQSAQVPGTLTRDPSVRPVFAERMDDVRPAVQSNLGATSAATSKEPAEPARPWFALTITLLALFASLGGNVFLGWVAHDSRKSYRRQLEEAR